MCVYNQHNVPPGGARTKGFHEHGEGLNYTDQLPASILDDRVIHPERSMGAPSHKSTDPNINLKQMYNPPAPPLSAGGACVSAWELHGKRSRHTSIRKTPHIKRSRHTLKSARSTNRRLCGTSCANGLRMIHLITSRISSIAIDP